MAEQGKQASRQREGNIAQGGNETVYSGWLLVMCFLLFGQRRIRLD